MAVKKSSTKDKTTGKKEESYENPYSIRFPPDVLKRIDVAYKAAGMKSRAEWVIKACKIELEHGVIGASPTQRETLANLLLYDEGIMDIIYQKIAEKLRLSDILSEIDDFAVHGYPTSDTELHLREFAAKIHYLVSNPFHEGEALYDSCAEFYLQWEKDWTLSEYMQLSPLKISEYHIFHLECRDPENAERGNGVYFWTRGEDDNYVKEHYLTNYFDEGECVHVRAGKILALNEDAQDIEGMDGYKQRIVDIVRYICRDNNLGDTKKLSLDDAESRKKLKKFCRTNYFIRQKGGYALGIPYEFRVNWVSDDKNSGKFDAENPEIEDLSIRPEVEVFWHYTPFEEEDTDIGETPFTRMAVPENIRYGNYLDVDGKKQSHVPVKFVPLEDKKRKDRKEYQKKRKTEVTK